MAPFLLVTKSSPPSGGAQKRETQHDAMLTNGNVDAKPHRGLRKSSLMKERRTLVIINF